MENAQLCIVCGQFRSTMGSKDSPREKFCSIDCGKRYYVNDRITFSEKKLTPKKAKEKLKNKTKLNDYEIRYFGWVANGRKRKKRK